MRTRGRSIGRVVIGALLLALLSGGWLAPTAGRAADGWVATGPLPPWDPGTVGSVGNAVKQQAFTATALGDGRVLAVGGFIIDTGAIHDPATNAWVPTAPLTRPRHRHTATLLPDGRVLVVGGWGRCCSSPFGIVDTERYDPAKDHWTPAAPLREGREGHTATLLNDGTVLVTGGTYHSASPSGGGRTHASAERYDPVADAWRAAAPLAAPRSGHTATRLADGTVLVVGGEPAGTAERYDPQADHWSPVAQPRDRRTGHTATLLHDGTVLVTGGIAGNITHTTAERYDPATDRWSPAAPLSSPRNAHSAPLLTDGTVVAAGGYRAGGIEGSAERYDPATDRWSPLPTLGRPRAAHGAALINGRVLIIGGENAGPAPTAEWYDPGTPGRCFAETGHCVRDKFLTYWGEHGGLPINGYPLSAEFPERLEDGKVYLVQYFERVRMEHHPANAAPNDVLLGQFGRRIRPADPALPPPTGPLPAERVYFPETGHFIIGTFFNYWYGNGGLAQFGYPISEVFEERLEDGKIYRVQYFERARFEFHSENADPQYQVLLGQFGRRILNGR